MEKFAISVLWLTPGASRHRVPAIPSPLPLAWLLHRLDRRCNGLVIQSGI